MLAHTRILTTSPCAALQGGAEPRAAAYVEAAGGLRGPLRRRHIAVAILSSAALGLALPHTQPATCRDAAGAGSPRLDELGAGALSLRSARHSRRGVAVVVDAVLAVVEIYSNYVIVENEAKEA